MAFGDLKEFGDITVTTDPSCWLLGDERIWSDRTDWNWATDGIPDGMSASDEALYNVYKVTPRASFPLRVQVERDSITTALREYYGAATFAAANVVCKTISGAFYEFPVASGSTLYNTSGLTIAPTGRKANVSLTLDYYGEPYAIAILKSSGVELLTVIDPTFFAWNGVRTLGDDAENFSYNGGIWRDGVDVYSIADGIIELPDGGPGAYSVVVYIDTAANEVATTTGTTFPEDSIPLYSITMDGDAAKPTITSAVSVRTWAQIGGGGGNDRVVADPDAYTPGHAGADDQTSLILSYAGWDASTEDDWLTITAGEHGSNGVSIVFDVDTNIGDERVGTITIESGTATEEITVTQAATTIEVTPATQEFIAAGEAQTFSVNVGNESTPWTAGVTGTGFSITSGGSGTGDSSSLEVTAAENTGAERTGTLTVTIDDTSIADTCALTQVAAAGGGTVPSGSFLLAHLDNNATDEFGNHTLTPTNVTYSDSTVVSGFGYSAVFASQGDIAVTGNLSNFNFGTGDFNIEFLVYLSSVSSGLVRMFSYYVDTSNYFFISQVNASSNLYMSGKFGGSTTTRTATGCLSTGWQHIRVMRDSGVLYMFVDGVSQTVSNSTFTDSLGTPTNVVIGAYYNNGSTYTSSQTGYIDEVVIGNESPGTSNFTPEASPYTTS